MAAWLDSSWLRAAPFATLPIGCLLGGLDEVKRDPAAWVQGDLGGLHHLVSLMMDLPSSLEGTCHRCRMQWWSSENNFCRAEHAARDDPGPSGGMDPTSRPWPP